MLVRKAYLVEHRGVREECCTFVHRRSENPTFFEAKMVEKKGTVLVGLAPRNLPQSKTVGWTEGTFALESSGELFSEGIEVARTTNIIQGDRLGCEFNRKSGERNNSWEEVWATCTQP
ncbi:hypothetical protein GPALN_012101 [Globodera pallida]|nr:hypothetical protein GPALN_012101 [Globodera pallida]